MGKQAFISENQKIYTQTLENSLDQIKGFRHEMNNIISTIAGFVELERLDLLRSIYRRPPAASHCSVIHQRSKSQSAGSTHPLRAAYWKGQLRYKHGSSI